jgi:hypothetical protein
VISVYSVAESNAVGSEKVTYHATLKLRSESAAHAAATADAWAFVATAMPDNAVRLQTNLPALSPEEAEQQLLAGIATLNTAVKGRSLQVRQLRDLLPVDGALPFVLLEVLREQELTDRTRADLYLVFELAGSPEAQAALASVLADPSLRCRGARRCQLNSPPA